MEKGGAPIPLFHPAGTPRHTTPGQSFSSPPPLSALITMKKQPAKKKRSEWKEPAYLSCPIVYLFHGELIFTSPVTGSSPGRTAPACAAKPVSALYGPTLGRTFKPFNSLVIPTIQYRLCLKHLCCCRSLLAYPSTSFFSDFFSLFSLFRP